jgi:hypothetical protein
LQWTDAAAEKSQRVFRFRTFAHSLRFDSRGWADPRKPDTHIRLPRDLFVRGAECAAVQTKPFGFPKSRPEPPVRTPSSNETERWGTPLFKRFKIDPVDPRKWQLLSFRLSKTLELQSPVPRRAGHPTEWTIERLAQLAEDADRAEKEIRADDQRKKKVSKSVVAKKILKENRQKYSGVGKPKTLQNKISEAKRRHARLTWALVRSHLAEEERQSKQRMFGMAELGREHVG